MEVFNFPNINWIYYFAMTSKSGKFLKLVKVKFLSPELSEPTGKDVLLDLLFFNREWLCQGMFRLGIRKHFFTKRVIKRWLPKEVVNASTLSVFKRHLDNVLSNMLYLLVSPQVVRQLDEMTVDTSLTIEIFFSIHLQVPFFSCIFSHSTHTFMKLL